LHNLGLDYLQRYPALIEAVTPEEVQAAARKYLNPEAYALAIAGPGALER
jgi:zinc protease